ncbi:RsmB/NOP family class I SAM-dependent RNA methyltransferase [Sphingobacterium sp. DK4209]|uniref:RsmB/NOP family class I SAM-dependent RNA methyltransferase n=1 Tax=Sphingobacterium zhuxiongii TaxID=2662364 RepID=A0A5Q0Q8F7_9SPHI|nr:MULTISPECIES: RsmB/NOP family class I SAM-dependent RNA methyltransferase [unclassified Sphingobacterium]MVZ66820.1 RsmB/NOP family class I SAM-dependent RNA methyltransferase [Sphingobacterium sp. DK4209]QGA26255.1 RsmB/NOP family class I SAM-dependent RNA methyltransferase [Sphingobacterium sp. dk4302]
MEHNSRRVQQQVRNFERTLEGYQYQEPFSRYLTQFYKQNKQMGSSDRRMNSRYCYNLFRLGKAFAENELIERLAIAEFLCEKESALVQEFKPDWLTNDYPILNDKIQFITAQYGEFLDAVFPLPEHLSSSINSQEFISSHFIQPDLFIRVKRGSEQIVKAELQKKELPFTEVSDRTIALPNGLNLQSMSSIQGLYEVQDLSSQQSLNAVEAKPNESWWDACAASGGKSLLLLDQYPSINLMVSDVRASILRNLDERFDIAGIKKPYRRKILDLSNPVDHIMAKERFDGIIIDAPCSGSGTWGRTPEMLSKFQLADLNTYSTLQKAIVRNAIPYLKSGSSLIYITCSVFQDENEHIVDYIENELNLKLESMTPILGYDRRADSMFTAKFIKP